MYFLHVKGHMSILNIIYIKFLPNKFIENLCPIITRGKVGIYPLSTIHNILSKAIRAIFNVPTWFVFI